MCKCVCFTLICIDGLVHHVILSWKFLIFLNCKDSFPTVFELLVLLLDTDESKRFCFPVLCLEHGYVFPSPFSEKNEELSLFSQKFSNDCFGVSYFLLLKWALK